MELTKKQATSIVKYIRKVLEEYFRETKPDINDFITDDMQDIVSKEASVFVTFMRYPSMSFKGSSGQILPILPLGEVVMESAIKAAFKDRRVLPLTESELNDTVIELTILKKPSIIEVENFSEYPEHIAVGEDAIAIESKYMKALLTPQVAVIRRWNAKQFLSFALIRAGVDPQDKNKEIKVYKFRAQVFREKKPGGEIVEIKSM